MLNTDENRLEKRSGNLQVLIGLMDFDPTEGVAEMENTTERLQYVENNFLTLLQDVENEARDYRQRAYRLQWIHNVFSAMVAVLGVAAPALVTYQTQVDDPLFKLLAIILSAIVGASTALQATFRWGDQYRQTRRTAFDLDALKAKAEFQKQEIMETTDFVVAYRKMNELLGFCQRELIRIKQNHIESEEAITTNHTDGRRSAESVERIARSTP